MWLDSVGPEVDRSAVRLGVLCAVALLAVAQAQAQTISLVSLRSDGTAPTSISDGEGQPAATPDGRYVVFSALASNLVDPAVTTTQIYLRDRQAGTTELISQSNGGIAGNAASYRPTISNDGCRVAFVSDASNFVSGDSNYGNSNIFVHNRCTNPRTTEMIDVFPDGSPGSSYAREARISGNGRKVAFSSETADLVPGCSSGAVYVRDIDAHTTVALTHGAACVYGREPDISYDGSRVVFWHYADDYVAGDSNGIWDILLYDFSKTSNPISLVSAAANGTAQRNSDDSGHTTCEGSSTIAAPAISQDGRMVGFRSRAYGLVANVPSCDGTAHVYIKDTHTGDIIVASVDSSGVLGNADSSGSGSGLRPGLSADGQYVVFTTIATNLATATGGIYPNFVLHDNFYGGTIGFSSQSTSGFPEISAYGRHVVVYSGSHLDANFPGDRGFFVVDWGIPYPPTITKVVAGSKKIQVYFSAPTNTGASALTGYAVTCEGADGSSGIVTGTASPLTVTGLRNGVKYTCTVIAANSQGYSVNSNSVSKRVGSSIAPLLGILLN